MAEDKKPNGAVATMADQAAKMQAGRKAAAARRAAGPELTAKQKFMLSNVRQAGKACKLLADMLNQGLDISPEAAEACNTLSSEYVKAVS